MQMDLKTRCRRGIDCWTALSRSRLCIALGLALVLLLAACGGAAPDGGEPVPLAISVTGAGETEAGAAVELAAEVTGDNAAAAVVTWGSDSGELSAATGLSTVWIAPAAAGEYTITATVTYGVESATATHDVLVKAKAVEEDSEDPEDPEDPEEPGEPVPLGISITGNSMVVGSEELELTATVTGEGAEASDVVWSADYGSLSTESGPVTIWTASADDETVTVKATITVAGDTEVAEHVITVISPLNVDIHPAGGAILQGDSILLYSSASGGPDGEKLFSWSATGGLLESLGETGEIRSHGQAAADVSGSGPAAVEGETVRWTAPQEIGESVTITLHVSVAGMTAETAAEFTVVAAPPEVVIHGPTWGHYGERVTFTATVNGDPPAEDMVINWTGDSGELLNDTGGSVDWIAPAESRSYSIRAQLAGAPADEWSIHVLNVSLCPENGTHLDEHNPCQIDNIVQLQSLSSETHLMGHYVLVDDIDASATRDWNAGMGFMPIGSNQQPNVGFSGSFDGDGHAISNLFVNRPGTTDVGLFARAADAARVSNLRLEDVDITGAMHVGAVFGQSTGSGISELSRVRVSGSVSAMGTPTSAAAAVGGLVGRGRFNVLNSSSTAEVTGWGIEVGGLVGYLSHGTIEDSSSNGVVMSHTSAQYVGHGPHAGLVGGLAGRVFSSTIVNSDSSSTVWSEGPVAGGLVGQLASATGQSLSASITGSYTDRAATVTGKSSVGGLVGSSQDAEIRQSYSLALRVEAVNPSGLVLTGGLVGRFDDGSIEETYSVSLVLPASGTGGLVGGSAAGTDGTVASSYWATDSSGRPTSAGGSGAMGVLESEMSSETTFSGWSFGLGLTWAPLPLLHNDLPDLNSNPRLSRPGGP